MKRRYIKIGLLLGIALVVFVLERKGVLPDMSTSSTPVPTSPTPSTPAPRSPMPAAAERDGAAVDAGAEAIVSAFRAERSGIVVETGGRVDRILPDDLDDSPHQRFIVRLEGGHTVLIAHNIDLAARVPVREGDDVSFRGQYEWNDRGGVVHWTHHDPQGRREGGWIEHDDRRYR